MNRHVDQKTILFSAILILDLIFAYGVYGVYSENADLSPQSQWMLEAGGHKTFFGVVAFTGPWPPGYPILLFVARIMCIPPRWVNLLLFYLTLLLMFIVADKHLQNVNPTWLLSFYVLCGFNYVNLSQFTSEALVIPMSILTLLTLLEYLERQTLSSLFFLSVSCSVAFISRYHAMLWLLPLIVGKIVLSGQKSIEKVCLHLGGFGIAALSPIGAFMLRNYFTTGHLSGVSRLSRDNRNLAAGFAESTAFDDNVFLTLKTYFVDFLSPFKFASHRINQLPHDISSLEVAVFMLFALVIGIIILTLVRCRNDVCSGNLINELRLRYQRPYPVFVLAEFLVAYVFVTIIWWTIATPDPIYTRFMYPSYVYFIILMFAGYSFVEQRVFSIVPKLPFAVLYLSVAFINLYKIAYHLP